MVSYFVYVSEHGNIFMREIAQLLANGLTDLGYHTVFPAPGLPEATRDRVNLVVAPHEFFALAADRSPRELMQAARASVTIGVEQPGTPWFEIGARYSQVAARVLDISTYAVEELRRRGIPATHLQLGYHPSMDVWGGDVNTKRDVDVLFLGAATPRRMQTLAQATSLLSDRNTDIRLFEFPRPVTAPNGHFVASTAKWSLLARSRILLNIHRSSVPYLEWVRLLEAMANGCVVVSETCESYHPLVPGEHLLTGRRDYLGAYSAAALCDGDLLSEMAARAYDFVRSELAMSRILEPVCEDLNTLRRRPLRSEVFARLKRALPSAVSSVLTVGSRPADSHVEDAEAGTSPARARIGSSFKTLINSETQLIRRIEALESAVKFGTAQHVTLTSTPAWEACTPSVSVVIPCYNAQDYVARAIESVLAAGGADCEVIVVDDNSRDASREVLAEIMTDLPCLAMLVVARSANAGLPAARNLAVSYSRAPYVLMLDADNVVHPGSISKLRGALDGSPDAAFSYGILRKSDSSGLLSWLPWDLERLYSGNYIDALTLLRRTAFAGVGGYDEFFATIGGWEDYDLWLRLASSGGYGQFVASVVGDYTVRSDSLMSVVGLDTASMHQVMRARHPDLPLR